jgi:hypothetical protein
MSEVAMLWLWIAGCAQLAASTEAGPEGSGVPAQQSSNEPASTSEAEPEADAPRELPGIDCVVYAGVPGSSPIGESTTVPVQMGPRAGADVVSSMTCSRYGDGSAVDAWKEYPDSLMTVLEWAVDLGSAPGERMQANLRLPVAEAFPLTMVIPGAGCVDGPATLHFRVEEFGSGFVWEGSYNVKLEMIRDAFSDGDGDDVAGPCDNCWDVANPDQADGNGDGVGDACERG